MSHFERTRDLYKVLQVPRTASMAEIKASYRKLALRLHPDMHKDDPVKTAEFKSVAEAYAILSDEDKKNSYDYKIGIRFNKNRRAPPPPDYRSVKFPEKPKHWKSVWDHQTHYDMHYGDGMYKEVIRRAKKRAEAEGLFEYQSPLGEGFTFSSTNPELNVNPYARPSHRRAPNSGGAGASGRGGSRGGGFSFEYEEAYVNMDGSSFGTKTSTQQRHVHQARKAGQDLNGRRSERYEQYQKHKEEMRKNRQNAAFSRDETCVIL